jgi:hypothetical protein
MNPLFSRSLLRPRACEFHWRRSERATRERGQTVDSGGALGGGSFGPVKSSGTLLRGYGCLHDLQGNLSGAEVGTHSVGHV